MKSTPASTSAPTIAALSCGRSPSAGLTMLPTITRSRTPVSRRLPSIPNCGPGYASRNSSGSDSPTTLTPVSSAIENTPPIAIVVSAARSVPIASIGNASSASARRYAPACRPARGKLGTATGGSARTDTTRAATRAFSSGVSPGSGTNVPVDWSDAIFAATRSGSPSVSIR